MSKNGDSQNRLKVNEDKTSANCELIGLLPFDSAFTSIAFGYENALAIQLAIQHLNEGNGSLVPEVSDLRKTCPITFSVSFADSKRNQADAFNVMDELTRPSIEHGPCAIIGGFDSQVSKVTALVSGLRGIPQISPGSSSTSLGDKATFPLFGRTVPDDSYGAEIFLQFLRDTMGIRHLFVIYESHPYTRSIIASLRSAIYDNGWAPGQTHGRVDVGDDDHTSNNAMHMQDRIFESASIIENFSIDDMLHQAVKELKDSEYRFVLALTTGVKTTDRLMEIAYDEGVVGTDDGSYHWWFGGTLPNVLMENRIFEKDDILAKAYYGVGSIGVGLNNRTSDLYGKFTEQSRELKGELYRRHFEMVSKTDDVSFESTAEFSDSGALEHEWLFSQAPFLNESEWFLEDTQYYYETAGYSYDATILLGLSACNEVAAISKNLSTSDLDTIASSFKGIDHFNRLRRTNFTGATGNVQLDLVTGTRDGSTVNYIIDNWLPSDYDDNNITFRPTTTHFFAADGDGNWENLKPYIFSGGKTSLGPTPDLPPLTMKILTVHTSLFIFSMVALVIILLSTIWFAIWTCRHWNSRVVRASQPIFLLLLCFGVAVMSVAIVPVSLEFSNLGNWTCHSVVYLFVIGFGLVFSTIFAKTYRINKILMSAKKFQRISLSVPQTIFPVAIVFLFNIVMLVSITTLTPITQETSLSDNDEFERPTTQLTTCNRDEAQPLVLTLLFTNTAVLVLALYQTWRARNLSTEFAESKYIAIALLLCIVITALGFPLLSIFKEDPNFDALIKTFCITIYSLSILCFIFLPKMQMHNDSLSGKSASKQFFSVIGSSDRTNGTTTSTGERIVTRKSQFELAKEIKSLEAKFNTLKARERKLDSQNVKLRRRVTELGNGDDEDIYENFTSSFLLDQASIDSPIGKEFPKLNEMKDLDFICRVPSGMM